MARPRLKGSTDQSVTVYIVDDTDGTPEQGVVYDTASIAMWYRREGEAKAALSLVTLASASAAWADSGLIHVDDGVYRLDLPTAATATGAGEVTIGGSIPDMVVLPVTIPLVDYNNQDAVRLGLTSLPNAAAAAAGGLPVSTAGSLDLDAILADTNELQSDDVPGLIAALDTVVDRVEADTISIETKVDLIDTFVDTEIAAIKTVVDDILVDTGTTIPATITTIDNEIAAIDTVVDNVLVDTNELQADWVDGGRLDALLDAIPTTAMRGTDSAALASALATAQADLDIITGATGVNLLTATQSTLDAILVDTAEIGAAGAGLTNVTLANDLSATMKVSVQTAVDAAIDTAIAELSVAAPTATPTLRTGLMLLYMALRNKLIVQTSGTDALEVHNDAGTKIAAKLLTDDGSDYEEAKLA